MTPKNEAVEIAKKHIGLEEHINAIESVLSKHMNPEKMKQFRLAVSQAENQTHLEEPSPTRLDQCERVIGEAKDDVLLIHILYEKLGILGKMTA